MTEYTCIIRRAKMTKDVEVECQYTYLDSKCNDTVPVRFLIRENVGEWYEPLVEE